MKIKMKKTKKLIVILITLTMLFSRDFGVTMPRKVQAAGYGLRNPVTDQSSVTTWDCVYFGNYWQDDTNGDGVADNNDEKQPIKWRVLSVDGDDAFLLADQNLDFEKYNMSNEGATWETCTLRSWLNGYGASSNGMNVDYSSDNFIDTAFTEAEQNAIIRTNVDNENDSYYASEGKVVFLVPPVKPTPGGYVRRTVKRALYRRSCILAGEIAGLVRTIMLQFVLLCTWIFLPLSFGLMRGRYLWRAGLLQMAVLLAL